MGVRVLDTFASDALTRSRPGNQDSYGVVGGLVS